MSDASLAKVILHTDASVHICIPSKKMRSFYATANALISLISSPLDFVNSEYESCIESTQVLFDENVPPYEACPGVVLCYISESKDFVCPFPEIFSVVFSSLEGERRDEPLNMKSFLDGPLSLSDSKVFLLQYYLSFVNSLPGGVSIRHQLQMTPEALHNVLSQIFNTAFKFKPHEQPRKDLQTRFKDAAYMQLFEQYPTGGDEDLIPITEYCAIYENTGVARQDVLSMVHSNEIRNKKTPKGFLVDKFHKPNINKKKAGTPKVLSGQPKQEVSLFSNSLSWPAARVKKYIIDNHLFSNEVAEYIFTMEELSIYLNKDNKTFPFHEVVWFGQHFLIMPFDWDLKDKDGVTNRERMRKGKGPVVANPYDAALPSATAELHHMGQRKTVHACMCPFLHDKYHKVLHVNSPDENIHDALFTLLKNQFWSEYYNQLERANWDFDKIPHTFPNKLSKKG